MIWNGTEVVAEIKQSKGVMQGDTLSPSLFLCYVSDLPSSIKSRPSISCYMFADDLAIATDNIEDLQTAFNNLKKWSNCNNMEINTDKTKIIKFRKGGRLAKRDVILYGGENIINK